MGLRRYVTYEMKWIVNSMEGGITNSCNYLDTAKELWDSIETAYAQNRNNAWVLELKKEIAAFKHDSLSIGDNYSQSGFYENNWNYMSPELCYPRKPCCA